MLAVAL